MKIKILCKDAARIEAIRSSLGNVQAVDFSGGVSNTDDLIGFINGSAPDVFIIDGASERTLVAVEGLSLRRPDVNTIVISSDTSADFLMHAMRAGVREVIPLGGSPDALRAALTRCLHKRAKQVALPAEEGQVFTFLSCKGGSGATFLAANFAYALASEFGKRVALIDLNLQFGDAAIFVSESRPPSHLAELAQQIHRLDASLLAASMLEAAPNLFVLAAPDDPAHAGDVKREHVAAIVRLAKAHYDFVVLDVSRSLDAVSLQALDLADTIFPVLQLTLPFVRDGKRLLSIFHSLDYPSSKVQLVVNRYEKGGEFSLQDLEQALETKVAHVLPNSYVAAAASVNLGIPILKGNRANPISQQLLEMARGFVRQEEQVANGGWLSRMFSRPAAH